MVGVDIGHGDDRVDSLLMGGEAEFDGGRGYNLFDHEGAKPFMIQLLGQMGGCIVLGVQPYLSSDFVDRCGVSGRTVSWGLKLLCYPLCLQGSDTEEKGVPVKCN